jgi:hypothetical protein
MSKPERPGKRLFPNPFYALLLVASTLFVVTALAYLVAPSARRGAVAVWVERHGARTLGVEVVVMLAAGLLAMATDRWFPETPGRPPR